MRLGDGDTGVEQGLAGTSPCCGGCFGGHPGQGSRPT